MIEKKMTRTAYNKLFQDQLAKTFEEVLNEFGIGADEGKQDTKKLKQDGED